MINVGAHGASVSNAPRNAKSSAPSTSILIRVGVRRAQIESIVVSRTDAVSPPMLYAREFAKPPGSVGSDLKLKVIRPSWSPAAASTTSTLLQPFHERCVRGSLAFAGD